MRLDKYLCENNYFTSRNKAVYSIENGLVLVNDKVQKKVSFDVKDTDQITILGEMEYVSRGGFKLKEALTKFEINLENKKCLDIGISTGGFTDCMLKNNASQVIGIDTGTNQVHESILNNKNVTVYENTSFLDLDKDFFKEKIDFISIDVSFISLKKIMAHLNNLFEGVEIVALLKPQFEVGKVYMKNGVVKSSKVHKEVLDDTILFLKDLNFKILGVIESPILGGSGNKEFLLYIRR